MKKVFILYNLGSGTTLKISLKLSTIAEKIRELKMVDNHETDEDRKLDHLTDYVNQYEEGEECSTIAADEILDAFDRGEQPEDLSFF